jgi:crotonobetainyl-CoA:carnitine CoA-transferase CaiB-like acyl-CoA transferase
VKLSETPYKIERAPLLGEHNEEIYCQRLGYTKDDLVRMKGEGVV